MGQFEEAARLAEEGDSPKASTFTFASSPTLTTSTFAPEKSLDPGTENAPPPKEHPQGSSTWSKIQSLVFRQQTAKPTGESDVADETGCNASGEAMTQQDSVDQCGELIVRSLKKFPTGYPNLAAFADSDESFMLYRRFGYLQSRILLEKQDELRDLEAQLDGLDRAEMYSEPDNLFTRECQGGRRKDLLISIEKKFCEYASLLGAAQQLMSFNRPSAGEHRSVANYIENECPVDPKESEYVLCREDLITLRPGRENAWLDRSIERLLKLLHCPMLEYLFCTKESRKKASNSTQVYYSKERIEGCSVGIITIMILFLLIVPIYLLFHLVERSNGLMGTYANAVCIGILLVFTLIFSAVMSLFTTAKKHEILGAAAAYCAVLVVFLGNVGNNSPP